MQSDVVLLPGLHGSTGLFGSFMAVAPAWARCRPLHLPLSSDQTSEGLASGLVEQVGSLEGIVLVAESFSGPVAIHLSRLLARKVALLVLCNPLVQVPFRAPAGLAARLVQSKLVPSWLVGVTMASGDTGLGAWVLTEVRRLPRAVLAGRLETVFNAEAGSYRASLPCPVLAVLGSRDRLLSPRLASRVLSAAGFSRVVSVAAPHLVLQLQPSAVWRAISEEFITAA